jgi:hypothetical protein
MWEDPIVAEVHRIREKLAADCSFDIGVFFAELRKHQAATVTPVAHQKKLAEPTAEAEPDRDPDFPRSGTSQAAPTRNGGTRE